MSAPCPWHAAGLFIVGAAAMLVFVFVALRSAIGEQFSGPLDPRELAKNPGYVDDDRGFEKDLMPFIAQAFDQCLNAQERKWRLFKRSLWALSVAVVCLTAALSSYVLTPRPSPGGTNAMADDKPKPRPQTPVKPAPAAPETAPKPILGPYTITRGATIPNEPKSGSFRRDTTEKK